MPKSPAKPAKPKPARPATEPGAKRADLGAPVETYFARISPEHRKIAQRLHAMVTKAAPKAKGAIKWGMPVYDYRGMLCYIRAQAGYVSFGFYEQGIELNEPRGLLQGSGQCMRHVKIPLGETPDEKYLAGLVKQAARINERDEAFRAMAKKPK